MLSFIPHKNNIHSWRTMLFIFFVMIISGFAVYLGVMHGENKQIGENYSADNYIKQDEAEELVVDDFITDVNAANELFTNTAIAAESLNEEKNVIVPEKVALPEPPKIERNKNPETRLEEAKLYAKPQILSGKYIDISLTFQNMVIFEDGKVLDAYQISSGKRGMETPIGTFKIENKTPRAWSKGYGLWMPSWMAILPSGKIGIHELPIWPGGYQEGANHLGTPVSHGCIRLGKGMAKRVYDWADIGTPIIVHK